MLAAAYNDPMCITPSVQMKVEDVKSVSPSSPSSQLSKPVRPLTAYREFIDICAIAFCAITIILAYAHKLIVAYSVLPIQ